MDEHSQALDEVLELLPAADQPGRESKLVGPQREIAAQVAEGILSGGRDRVSDLVRRSGQASSSGAGEDPIDRYKPRYALRLLTLHVGAPGREELAREYRATLVSLLGASEASTSPRSARRVAIEELEIVGDASVVEALEGALADDELWEPSVRALTAIGKLSSAVLRRALATSEGRRRVAIIQALGLLRDEASIDELVEFCALEDGRNVGSEGEGSERLAAVVALANIGKERSVPEVLRFADAQSGWERIQSTKACFVLAERLVASNETSAAREIYTHLRATRKDPSESHVRESAERALAAL